jgi:hypothetical protein
MGAARSASARRCSGWRIEGNTHPPPPRRAQQPEPAGRGTPGKQALVVVMAAIFSPSGGLRQRSQKPGSRAIQSTSRRSLWLRRARRSPPRLSGECVSWLWPFCLGATTEPLLHESCTGLRLRWSDGRTCGTRLSRALARAFSARRACFLHGSTLGPRDSGRGGPLPCSLGTREGQPARPGSPQSGTGGYRTARPSRFPTKVTGPSPSSKGPSPSSKGLGPADSPPRSGLQRGSDLPEQLGES